MIKQLIKLGSVLIPIVLLSNFQYLEFPQLKAIAAAAIDSFNLKLPPPPNRGIVGKRVGGASRILSEDPSNESGTGIQSITAFVPEYQSAGDSGKTGVWGLTSEEHPTFWFYIPTIKSSLYRLDFSIYDESGRTKRSIYQAPKELTNQSGLVRFILPNTSQSLNANKLYQWELKVVQKRGNQEQISVKGWVQKSAVNNQLKDRIRQSSPEQKAALYAENGLWYDTFTTLATLHYKKPQDPQISQNWQNLLDSVELGHLANQPLLDKPQLSKIPKSGGKGF